MAKKRLTKGTVIEVHFLDHVQGSANPYEFVVFGRVTAIDRRSIVVESWTYTDEREPDKTNVVSFTIVRAAITNWWKLERA